LQDFYNIGCQPVAIPRFTTAKECPMSITHIHMADLPVSDIQRARDFYRDKVGLSVATDAPYGESRWVEMVIDGARTRIFLEAVDRPIESHPPAMVLIVDDLEVEHQRLLGHGVEITAEPQDAPWQPGDRFATFLDSEGNTIVLTQKPA
jgi:predicted enzyme related to lactoylglutathione lyase